MISIVSDTFFSYYCQERNVDKLLRVCSSPEIPMHQVPTPIHILSTERNVPFLKYSVRKSWVRDNDLALVMLRSIPNIEYELGSLTLTQGLQDRIL